MADDDIEDLDKEDEEEEEKEGKKKGFSSEQLVKIFTYGALFLSVIAICIATYVLISSSKSDTNIPAFRKEVYRSVADPRDVYQIPEFKLALDKRDDESMTTIVQVKLGLAYESENQQVLNEIIKRKEQIRDKVQYIIARKRYEDIDTAESRDKTLKEDLLYSLNSILKDGEILNIYFDTFVISRIPG